MEVDEVRVGMPVASSLSAREGDQEVGKGESSHSVDGVLFHACSLDGLWLIHDNYPSSIPLFYIIWDTLRNLT